MNKINHDLIAESVDNTLKQIKERSHNVLRKVKTDDNNPEEEKNALRKKLEKKAKKKEEMLKIKIEEDLPFEKEIR